MCEPVPSVPGESEASYSTALNVGSGSFTLFGVREISQEQAAMQLSVCIEFTVKLMPYHVHCLGLRKVLTDLIATVYVSEH